MSSLSSNLSCNSEDKKIVMKTDKKIPEMLCGALFPIDITLNMVNDSLPLTQRLLKDVHLALEPSRRECLFPQLKNDLNLKVQNGIFQRLFKKYLSISKVTVTLT